MPRKSTSRGIDAKLESILATIPPEKRGKFTRGLIEIAEVIARLYQEQPNAQTTQYGEAYWVFNTQTHPDKIRRDLEEAREYTPNVGPHLKIELLDSPDLIPDRRIKERAKTHEAYVKDDGPVYVCRARLPGSTNRQSMHALGNALQLILPGSENELDFFKADNRNEFYLTIGRRCFDSHEEEQLPSE